MSLVECIRSTFHDSAQLKGLVVESLAPMIVEASGMLVKCFRNDGKVLSCGNGGSACDAQHFNAELVGRFQRERGGLPAMALTTDTAVLTAVANDYEYVNVFSRQVKALGREGDILLAISTSGNSPNIVKAISQGQSCGMKTIALTGRSGGDVANILQDGDIEMRVPSDVTARIQEIHILIIHCLCDLVDKQLFGKN